MYSNRIHIGSNDQIKVWNSKKPIKIWSQEPKFGKCTDSNGELYVQNCTQMQ